MKDTAADKGPTLLHIGDKWVNVETWKKSHPGGAACLERLNGSDCTEMFMSIHSKEARKQLESMKSVSPPAGYVADQDLSVPNQVSKSFRAFAEQLEKEGWFERHWHWDAFYISVMLSLCAFGTMLSHSHPWIAIAFIGLGMQQAGWIAHDYVHARGTAAHYLGRLIGGLVNGFSAEWWSNKHNKHHVHTNQLGIDDDIANDPILHLWVPTPNNDFWFRKYQHYYYHFVYAALYASWRLQSFQFAYARKSNPNYQKELLAMFVNFLWLAYLGPFVAIGSIIWGGWLVAEVVTATHQSEDMIPGISYQFAEDQFRTTRNVHIANPVGNWFWGGMQWQLEHHLFPTMPKYRYMELSPKLKQWAEANKISYRSSDSKEILLMNFNTMKKYATMSWQQFQSECKTHIH